MPTLTKKNISVTIAEPVDVTELHDGNFLVHVGAGTATITAYSPARIGAGGGAGPGSVRNGAAINLPGNAELQPRVAGDPFDGRTNYSPEHALSLPRRCVAGDVAIIALSKPSGTDVAAGPRPSYWSVPGDSFVDEMLNVMFVGYPRDAATPRLRPFGLGADPELRQLRGRFALREDKIDLSRLPSVIELGSLQGVDVPTWAEMESLVSDFCGEVRDGWGTRYVTPDLQNPGYGSHKQGFYSQCYVMLCSTESSATKRKLARSLVQWGLDLAGAYHDGRLTEPNGGNIQGCKGLIILAGHLLDIRAMRDPDAWLGEDRFADSMRVGPFDPGVTTGGTASEEPVPARWWFGTPDWPYRWDFLPGGWGEFQRRPPGTWTTIAQSGHGSQEFGMQYLNQVAGCHVGQALAFELMGLRAEMGEGYMRFIEQWMTGPPPAARDQLAAVSAALGALRWGEDYSVGQGAGMCRAAWQRYWP